MRSCTVASISLGFSWLLTLAAGCTSFEGTSPSPSGSSGQGGTAGGGQGGAGAAGVSGQAGAGQGGAGQGGAGAAGQAGQVSQAGAAGAAGKCQAGMQDCDGDGSCESNSQADPENCGACGNSCSFVHAKAFCGDGKCQQGACDQGYDTCDGKDGCEIDTRNDPQHCGSCAIQCQTDEICVEGSCAPSPCQQGQGDCDGKADNGCEADLSSSDSCGFCGNVCGFPNATGACAGGACKLLACVGAFADCNASEGDGCETNTGADVNNCGGCGLACKLGNAEATCKAGACEVLSCAGGYADCDGKADNGCETNLLADAKNCGLCGNLCPEAGGNPSCEQGQCGVSQCASSKGDCNANKGDGCETDLLTDAASCGVCGAACALANAKPRCEQGLCALAAGDCNEGYADCDGQVDNGCETNLLADAASCGACGTVCSGQNGVASCVGGACKLVCNSGYADCDGKADNGCEVKLSNDPANCGSCGRGCLGGECSVNICQPFTLSSTLAGPSGLHVANTHVLVATESGKIFRFNQDKTVDTLVDDTIPIADVTEVDAGFFWLERKEGKYALRRLDKGAPLPTTVESHAGTPVRLVSGQQRIHWAGSDGVFSYSLQTGKTLTVSLDSGVNDLNVADGLAWTVPTKGEVRKAPAALSPVSTAAAGQAGPWGIDGDSLALYWSNSDAGTLVELPASALDSPTVISSGHKLPRFLTVESNYVYFSTEDSNASGDVGQIRRFPRKGGSSVLIAGKQKNVVGLRHSDTLICWIRRGDFPTANGALVCRAR